MLTVFILDGLHHVGLREHTDTGSRNDKRNAYAIRGNGDIKYRPGWIGQIGNFTWRRS